MHLKSGFVFISMCVEETFERFPMTLFRWLRTTSLPLGFVNQIVTRVGKNTSDGTL